MANHTISPQPERAAILAIIKALDPAKEIDCTNEQAINATENTMQKIADYRKSHLLEYEIWENNTPGYFIAKAEKLLRQCLIYEAPQDAPHRINEALHNALNCLPPF